MNPQQETLESILKEIEKMNEKIDKMEISLKGQITVIADDNNSKNKDLSSKISSVTTSIMELSSHVATLALSVTQSKKVTGTKKGTSTTSGDLITSDTEIVTGDALGLPATTPVAPKKTPLAMFKELFREMNGFRERVESSRVLNMLTANATTMNAINSAKTEDSKLQKRATAIWKILNEKKNAELEEAIYAKKIIAERNSAVASNATSELDLKIET